MRCNLVHSMQLTWLRNRVQQVHIQAGMQGMQKGQMSHLVVKFDVGIEVARHPQHHLYHPDNFQGIDGLGIATLVAA